MLVNKIRLKVDTCWLISELYRVSKRRDIHTITTGVRFPDVITRLRENSLWLLMDNVLHKQVWSLYSMSRLNVSAKCIIN